MSSLFIKNLKIIFMSKSKNFFLNGEKYYIEDEITILELVNYFNYNTSLLVLEYNNLICNKKEWSNISINNNDKIEIVTIVGGG
jgi:sulfur carrier protein